MNNILLTNVGNPWEWSSFSLTFYHLSPVFFRLTSETGWACSGNGDFSLFLADKSIGNFLPIKE